MKSVPAQVALATLWPFVLLPLVLWLLASPSPQTAPGLLFAFGAVLAAAGLLTAVVLVPLRADLQDVAVLAGASAGPSGVPTLPRTHEAAPLIEGLALLRARSLELAPLVSAARREVEEAALLRVRFVAAMGHDLRGPLNAIVGFSDLLVMEGQDAVAAEQRHSVELIRRSAADLLVLLEQILDWAKLEAGQITLEREALALDAVLASAAREAEHRSADRGLSVALDVPSSPLHVQADSARLVEALLGLLDHATRATDSPTVSLRARRAPSEGGRSAVVRIEVHDPLLLIREADRAGFFDALRPSFAPSGRRVAGLGLGPALARALIRAHGGEVSFSSDSEQGTVFTVELPPA